MDHKDARHFRLHILAILFFAVMAVYLGVLFNTQVNHYDEYYASSIRTIARPETVEAARGNITDRNGKVLVSSRSSYNLTFDASLLDEDEDANEAILRLLELCQERGINWVDALPITRSAPFAYTLDSLDSTACRRFLTYLKDLDGAAEALGAYLLEHPALLETTDEDGDIENPADDILAGETLRGRPAETEGPARRRLLLLRLRTRFDICFAGAVALGILAWFRVEYVSLAAGPVSVGLLWIGYVLAAHPARYGDVALDTGTWENLYRKLLIASALQWWTLLRLVRIGDLVIDDAGMRLYYAGDTWKPLIFAVGLAVLWRTNPSWKQNLFITGLTWGAGAFLGVAMQVVVAVFA